MMHYVIPDTQTKPGVPVDHMRWIGLDILRRRPDVVVHLGDGFDLPSLSSYDKGKKSMEGRRVSEDVACANEAIGLLTLPSRRHNSRCKEQNRFDPRWVYLLGNHEHRMQRAIEDQAQLDGTLGMHLFDLEGWEVHDFLEPVFIDGIGYAHYWYNPMNGRPYSGAALNRLKTIGHSYSMGHQQTLDFAIRPVGDTFHHGLVAGACYLHDEEYKGYQGNSHWRGVIVKNEVRDGHYDIMPLSLDYLCREYEGVPLREFLRTKYPEMTGTLWR